MIEHMTEDHIDIKKEEYMESRKLAVELANCKKVFYSEEDLEQHNQVQIHCPEQHQKPQILTFAQPWNIWKIGNRMKKSRNSLMLFLT